MTSGSTARAISTDRFRAGVRRYEHDIRTVRAAGGAGHTGELDRLVTGQLPWRALDDVQPDGIGARQHRRHHPFSGRDAADLHVRPTRYVGRVVGLAAGRDERSDGGTRIVGPHQRLADQRGIEAERAPARDRGRVPDPGFGDHDPVVRDQRPEPVGALGIDVERAEIAVVDPDQARTRGERRLELTFVVGFDQRLEAELERPLDQRRQCACVVEDGQEQHDVGARGAQYGQLPFVDDELLGQHRDPDGGPHLPQIVDRAAEPVRLAQDRDGRRAAGLVGAGPSHDVIALGRDPAGRRGRPLELRDDVESRCGQPCGDGPDGRPVGRFGANRSA
jgi:hypothetical protein